MTRRARLGRGGHTNHTGGIPADIRGCVSDPARLRERPIDRAAYASDASHYLFTPRGAVIAESAREVAAILAAASRSGEPVTFRSGGTSLSGQASGAGVIVDVRQRFRGVEVLDDGQRVRVEPGATVRQVNVRLAKHGTRLGPDPASEIACTVGGVIANNSSGMACGTDENSYRTLESLVVVLPSGTVVDTARDGADAHLREAEPELFAGLEWLRDRVRSNPTSVAAIQRMFALKNTMGYGVNAFLDFDSPTEILAHLIVGSEGTLAFIAEATFRTVPVQRQAATALVVLPTLDAAVAALPSITASGAAAIELMDATSLAVGQRLDRPPAEIVGFEPTTQAALLIEYRADDDDALAEASTAGARVLEDLPLHAPAAFSTDAGARARAWAFRKGLYASVAGARPSGTTALLEDIVVPPAELAGTCTELQSLFTQHDYRDAVIFGHAKDGNLHFMVTDRFEGSAALTRHVAFTESLVDLVLGAGGNLKAEHGTGRAMAPFVSRQYGDELYDVMVTLKRLCDPRGIMNPGVLISDDPKIHLRGITETPTIEPEADRCVECGYCEPVCPSRDLTLTPRQRIAVRRASERAQLAGDSELVSALAADYDYDGVQTCAVDGMCATACPVGINTGDLVKRLRREASSKTEDALWSTLATQWGVATRGGARALTAARALPTPLVRGATQLGRAVLGADTVPRYDAGLPGGGPARSRVAGVHGTEPVAAIFVPACVGSMFGPEDGGMPAGEALLALAVRAGVGIHVPDDVENLCCGTPWSSKGRSHGLDTMRRRAAGVAEAARAASVPVIVDASSCTEGFASLLEPLGVDVIDAVAFTAQTLLPRLTVAPRTDSLVIHPTCSSEQLGTTSALLEVARAVASEVRVPETWGCCGFAGDRGMLHPELTAAATAAEAAEVRAINATAHASCNRTCEIGMTRATGKSYRHVLELLEEATRP
ncbi:FAD-binding and (Fe-S)-binding domain-containing protein [Leucobacter sp. NPDC058333]|uniref:FAD-binding and (Fe-S)-binding domain-containing protein n=1 Tax=Leucobacter sp. NPDC058333 TaxID=3346450 RepID=UPI0036506A61